ncbi:SDR family NAD(P)-dependent oxidoreductase [Myxococcus faecalis]|uniref:SDR family NAD(P)-dependent oxidoreductase n=1 Tax=Myxococcus faecalis TaxID=3115646 RepID=UPI003CF669FE
MLKDKRVVITGGGRGLGLAFTRAFLEQGAKVTITGRNPRTLDEASEALGGRVATMAFDVSDASATRAAFDRFHQHQGAIDVLVNNAGIWPAPEVFWKTPLEQWEAALDINLKGTVYCTHTVLQHMVSQGQGIIINMASNAGVVRWPTCSAYSVSKAAIVKLTENLSCEARRHGVTLFAYHPGLVHSTGLVPDHIADATFEGTPLDLAQKWLLEEKRAGRMVDAEQSIINLLKLASGAFAALSGCYLTVQDDLAALLADKEAIRADDLLTLRVKKRSA